MLLKLPARDPGILDYLTGLLRIEALSEQEADEKTKDLLQAGNITRFLNL